MSIWIPILVMVLGICLLGPLVCGINYARRQHRQEITTLNAETYSERMRSELSKGLTVTNTLEQILISEKGQINDFDTIAKNLMSDYIQCIELAQVSNAVDRGIEILNPAYISKEDGESPKFWGFTVTVTKAPKIFENSIEALTRFGYNYRLSVKSKTTNDEWRGVCCSGVELIDPISKTFDFGCNEWKLEVVPAADLKPKLIGITVNTRATPASKRCLTLTILRK